MNPEVYGTPEVQLSLEGYKSQPRNENPDYVFIQKNLWTAEVHFIALLMIMHSTDQWIQGQMETLVDQLFNGMKVGEVAKVPILIGSTEKFINEDGKKLFYSWPGRNYDPTNPTWRNTKPWALLTDNKSTTVSASVDWKDIRNKVPADVWHPEWLGYSAAFAGQFSNNLYLPYSGTERRRFGLSLVGKTKEEFYTWMNARPTHANPPSDECEPGYHKDANGDCVLNEVPEDGEFTKALAAHYRNIANEFNAIADMYDPQV